MGDVVDAGCLQRPQIPGRSARRQAQPQGAGAIPEGSGTAGRSCYGDAEQTAAILLAGGSVELMRVQLMRWDEHGWDQYGPAHIAEVRAGVDADGNLVAYEYHGWQHGWTVTSTIYDISLQKLGVERSDGSASITANPMSTGSMYKVPNRKVVSHAVPMAGYLRGAALRSPLDLSFAFASEQTIEELAHAIKMDPLEFRRKNIGDKRWLGVLDAAGEAANWMPRPMASSLSDAEVVTGRGIGLGTHHVSYGAAVADIEVNKRTGNVVVKKIFAAMDVGLAVNPGLVENQIIGQAVQSVSRVLKEEVTFDKTGVYGVDWNSIRFYGLPSARKVVPIVVQRMEEPSSGAGEEVMGATRSSRRERLLRRNRLTVAPISHDSGTGAHRPCGRAELNAGQIFHFMVCRSARAANADGLLNPRSETHRRASRAA